MVDNGSKNTNTKQQSSTEYGDDDELPTISNVRTRTSNTDWEEYADLIEDTDDLK